MIFKLLDLKPKDQDLDYNEETIQQLKVKLNTHKQMLTPGQVRIVVSAVVLTELLAMCDTVGISMAIPLISQFVNAEKSQWTSTEFSISNSVITFLSGRFSDIFGCKPLLLTFLAITSIFELVEGFFQSPA